MTPAWRPAAIATAPAVGTAVGAQAQPATPLPDPETPSRVQLGPVGLSPALVLREIGYDSNVRNEGTGEQGDFTATLGGRLDLVARLARVVASSNAFYQALLDDPTPQGDPDRVATYGAGVGVRLGDESRVAINIDHTTRSSTVPSREYKRNRVPATVTYGF